MILTVTLNPLLEFRYSRKCIEAGNTYRDAVYSEQAGGKGINVSRQLLHFGVQSFVFTFTGPLYGKKFKELIDNEGIKNTVIRTKADTRTASVFIDEDNRKVTSFFSPDPFIRREEADEFLQKLLKIIQNCEIVVLSGSSPSEETDFIFCEAIKAAVSYDKISVLDTYGRHFSSAVKAGPTILHTNVSEAEKSLDISLQTEEDIKKYLLTMYGYGIKQVYLTNGGKDTYASNFDFVYKVSNPAIRVFDETGSGDAFTAGIVYGLFHDMVFEDTLKFASALGAANAAVSSVCAIQPGVAEQYFSEIGITTIGKKMKLIDVSSNH